MTTLLQPVKDRGGSDWSSFSFFGALDCTALAGVPLVAELSTSERFLLLIKCALVCTDSIQAAMACAFRHKLLFRSTLKEPSCTGYPQGVVSLEACYVCLCTETLSWTVYYDQQV